VCFFLLFHLPFAQIMCDHLHCLLLYFLLYVPVFLVEVCEYIQNWHCGGEKGMPGFWAAGRAAGSPAAAKRGQKGRRWRSLTSLAGWGPLILCTCAVRWV
jgi:hypothetical protein